MRYVEMCGERVGALGMGTMRLPVLGGRSGEPGDPPPSGIDEPAAIATIDAALASGINYVDTAWGYHAGESERLVGKALSRHPRESFNLTTKFPSYNTDNFGKHVEIFAEQLEKCQTTYFDYYLLHNINETNIDPYLDDIGRETVDYFKSLRDEGRIRHLGFSTHATTETFDRFIDAYGSELEFCQIELNYLDWDFQDARHKVSVCTELGLPIVVMEPLRGGFLCELSDAQMAPLEKLRPQVTAREWAFRWLETVVPGAVVLSGMGSPEMVEGNARIFSEPAPLDDAEMQAVSELAREMAEGIGVPCTACRYCTDYCPQGLDIPELLALYNEMKSRGESTGFIAPMRISTLPEDKRPSACVACGSCARVCPQQIEIPKALATLAAATEK